MFSLFYKKSTKKADICPVRAVFFVVAFLLLLAFLILIPIYKNANLTPQQHLQYALVALKQDQYPKAKAHLLRATKAQNAYALYILGTMEIEGKNNDKKANPKQAAVYFESAADLGLKEAQYALALLYDRGEGVEQDKKKALKWAKMAAAQGDINAIYASAVWFERGYSGTAEQHAALILYEQAAERGHLNAMTTLVSIYSGGTDIPANKQRAEFWKNQLKKQIRK